ncbi:MAG TPA: type II toxin-antitoxin system death-on-curing family toxin [Clostridiaceae bacterium]|nr:type II toxin-antitoxin system death-on-curing family toxin [Clostridiaceae bacterium]
MTYGKLTLKQVKAIHHIQIETFGGIDGIRDEGLLESAIESPFQTFDGLMLYEDPIERIVRVVFNIIKNHPFLDGNKRTGIAVLMIMSDLYDIEITASDEEYIELGLRITALSDHHEITDWINDHISLTKQCFP